MSKLLVAEDDEDVAHTLELLFTGAGHEVTRAADGRSALRRAYEGRPDLVVLDVSLPELDGWGVLERLRDLTDVPVLMLTARDQPSERVRGLRSGADDYLTKPFVDAELLARVEALLRRSPQRQWDTEPYDDGVLRIDPVRHEVSLHGRRVRLTPTEFRLLLALARRSGAVLSPAELLAEAWGDPTGLAPGRVKFAVLRLRRKLGWHDPKTSPLESLRSVGYRYRRPG